MAKNRQKIIQAVESRIVPFSEGKRYLRCLVYGRNGTQKTRFAATGPDVILCDINEEGTTSVQDFPGYVYYAKKYSQVEYFFWYLKYGDHRFRTVVIDNLTTLQNVVMRQILKEAVDRDPNRPPRTPITRDWGTLRTMMEALILDFRNLDMHVVFLAQERRDKNAEEGSPEVVPDLSPAVRSIVTGAVDVIGRTFQKKIRVADRRTRKEKEIWVPLMLVGPHEDYITKDRTYNLGQVVVRPTVPRFIEAKLAKRGSLQRRKRKNNG